MAPNRFKVRKVSNVENMPPQTKRANYNSGRKISSSLTRHSAHRIRARVNGVSRRIASVRGDVALSASHAKPASPPRITEVQVGAQVQAQAQPQQNAQNVLDIVRRAKAFIGRAPRTLARPHHAQFGLINPEAAARLDPQYQGVPLTFVRERLSSQSSAMQDVCKSIRLTSPLPGGYVPDSVNANVRNPVSDMPTRMLALRRGREIQLYPIHDIVFAVHCSKWPQFEPSQVAPEYDGGPITLPVVPLDVPSVSTFPLLSSWLHTQDDSQVLAFLIPALPAGALSNVTPGQLQGPELATLLGNGHTFEMLMHYSRRIMELRDNMAALGVGDTKLWYLLNIGWSVVRAALIAKLAEYPF